MTMGQHKHYRFFVQIFAICSFLLVGPIGAADDEGTDSIGDAIAKGDASFAFRYRYEFVDQASFDEDAHASTVKLRLNYRTGDYRSWHAFVEFDYVAELLLKDFNSGAGTSGPNRDQYPIVADPDGPDLNQLYLQYAPSDKLSARFGRQRINLNDQRFVGGVGWRQNEQTYDSLSIDYGGLEKTTVFYSYVAGVNRIFGSSVPAGQHDHNTHLLNVNVQLSQDMEVIGYAYLIDNEDMPAFSTNTFGIRAEGGIDVGKGRLALLGEYATQSDAGDNAADFDADYYRLQALWQAGAINAGIGYEVLGSDSGQGFRTPLATLHAFNGWADQFVVTPGDGLEDLYVRLGGKIARWTIEGRYHDFGADVSSESYASEIDLQARRDFGKRYSLLLKAAIFDSDSANFDDVTKVWVMMSGSF